MRYGSVCSGIEAATAAWHHLGWEPQFFSEIEPFPCAVLAHHYPDVPNYGDMTKFKEWPDATIDVLVGGTPCQSFSVAGLRKGLADPRGNLMLTYVAIARRYRPSWVVWENVPGVLSSNKGRDFGSLLGLLTGQHIEVPPGGWQNSGVVPGYKGAYGIAWRVLDSQFIRTQQHPRAVPQRRRRVFLVGYLGDWRRAAAVLLERGSMSGNSAPSRKAGQKPTLRIAGGIDYEGNGHGADEPTGLLLKGSPSGGGHPLPAICMSTGQAGAEIGIGIGIGTTLNCNHEAPIITIQDGRVMDKKQNGKGWDDTGVAFTLDGVSCQAVAGTLNANGKSAGSATQQDAENGMLIPVAFSVKDHIASSAVRRLTPRECERLQGFPDDYTLVSHRGKPAADGPRYKALGNSMAVPVMGWIGERIQTVEELLR